MSTKIEKEDKEDKIVEKVDEKIDEEEEEENIQKILRQTDYTEEKAREKYAKHKQNVIAVIKEFMGIPEKKEETIHPKAVQQAIYKQLRLKLDNAMKDYNKKQEIKLQEDLKNQKDILG